MEIKKYKIRRKRDGFFSTGGTNPKWNKIGKEWNTIGHVKLHILQWLSNSNNNGLANSNYSFNDFEIVESLYEITLKQINLLNFTSNNYNINVSKQR